MGHTMELLLQTQSLVTEHSYLQDNSEVTIDADVTCYVQTETLAEAMEALQEKGLVVLCGDPGSGKTTLSRGLLRKYREMGYTPYAFTSIKDWHLHVSGGRRTIVLMDNIFGQTRIKQERQEYWDHIRTNVVELMARGDCKLVIIVYPHVLRELQRLERGTGSPLLDCSVIVHMPDTLDMDVKMQMIHVHLQKLHIDPVEQRQLVENILQNDISGPVFPWCCDYMTRHWHSSDEPTAVFTRPAEAYVALFTHMFSDPKHGAFFAAVLLLSMTGHVKDLSHPQGAKPELERLGIEGLSHYHLAIYADILKGFILTDSGDGFFSRLFYDAAGMALAHFSLPFLLSACDSKFLVQHMCRNKMDTEFGPRVVSSEIKLCMERFYDDIIKGHASLICQHPVLQCTRFLEQFKSYCESKDNGLHNLFNAKDSMYNLPFLYWSVWSVSPYLTHWCLMVMTENPSCSQFMSDDFLLGFLMGAFLLKTSNDTRDLLKPLLANLHFAEGTSNLVLPCPGTFLTKQSEILPQSFDLCYLNNPSLPIPATLLSVTVTEDAVSVELPTQHWYLALKLLADREVDETDRDGNTLLHIAADKGNLEAITLAVKSGASLTKTNTEGLTPYQLAQRRQATGRGEMASDLFSAIRDGNEVAVKEILCYGSSVNDKDEDGSTCLTVACQYGQGHVTDLLIELGADVNVTVPSRSGAQTLLHFACYKGLPPAAELLVKHHADVGARNDRGETALHCACHSESPAASADITRLLLDAGADVNARDEDGTTPLHNAVRSDQQETLLMLIDQGADVQAQDKDGTTPLHDASRSDHTETPSLLIDCGADVNAQDEDGNTPLHDASRCDHRKTVKLLIDRGADVNASDEDGNTPLHDISRSGQKETHSLLIDHGADLNAKNKDGRTPLYIAYLARRPDIITQLVEAGAETGRVHQAVVRGDVDALMTLLQQGADVNQHDTSMGCSPLHAACLMGHTDSVTCLTEDRAQVNAVDCRAKTPLHYVCQTGATDIASCLIQHEAQVNTVDNLKKTPLHYACEKSATDIVPRLMEQSAQVNAVDKRERTPLHYACEAGATDIVHCLVQQGAHVNVVDRQEKTVLHCACQTCATDMVMYLIQQGAKVNAADNEMKTPLHYACETGPADMVTCLIQHGAQVNAVAKKNRTPLHYTCETGATDIATCLIQCGAWVNAVDYRKKTPLHYACETGATNMAISLIQQRAQVNAVDERGKAPLHYACEADATDIVTNLIQHGAQVNAVDNIQRTPLHYACQIGATDIVTCLIHHGAQVNAADNIQRTPLQYARQRGATDIVTCLIHHEVEAPLAYWIPGSISDSLRE